MSIRLTAVALLGAMTPLVVDGAESARRDALVFIGGGPPHIGLYIADADGRNEAPFLATPEARNYNPSFSPDGRWIVFSSDRGGSSDVYRVHPEGGGLERLTDDPAFDDQGALSPDGRSLAFVSSRSGGFANVWMLDLAHHRYSNVTRSRSGNFRPSWSPDGRWLAFTSDRDMPHKRSGPDASPPQGSGCCGWEMVQSTALYVVHPDGSGLRRLTSPDAYAGSPAWSADGRRIAFYDERGQIVAIDVASGRRSDLTTTPGRKWAPQWRDPTSVRFLLADGGKMFLAESIGPQGPGVQQIWNPSWTPDGSRVVYARSDWSSSPAAPAILPFRSFDPGFNFYRAVQTQAWSPDGRKILVARPFEGESTLNLVNPDGSDPRTLYDTKDRALGIVNPVWSPDGTSIVFTLGRYGSRNPVTPAQLARVRADGSGFELLTRGESGSGYATFSPDGTRLVFRRLGNEEGLRLLSLDTGKITVLTNEPDNFPAWSPRGDLILFTGLRTGDFEMYTIRPDGSGLRQLTHDHGNDAHGRWSPDGRRIVFTTTRTGWKDETRLPSNDIQSNGELAVMDADGSHRRQLTDDQWEEAVTAWLPSR